MVGGGVLGGDVGFFPQIPRDGSDNSEECKDLKQTKPRSINMGLPRGRTVLEKGFRF